jgi:LEA14-like dessication related protein
MKYRLFVPIAALCGLALGAAGSKERSFHETISLVQKPDIEISVREKRIAEPSVEGLTLAFHLVLRNLSERSQSLVRYDYRIAIDEIDYLQLQTDLEEPIRIEPNGETVIALPVRLTAANLFPAVPALKEKDGGVCYVSGGMTFRDDRRREKRVPIAFSGEFPVYRGFEGGVAPVEVKTLTIGGAEITMKIVIRNLNGFPVVLDRLAYKLELVGRAVSEGEFGAEAGTKVEGRGEASFTVPLILDFFELGKGVYNGLEQPPVAVRVSGEALVTTPWGSWRVPIEKSDKVAVIRTSS